MLAGHVERADGTEDDEHCDADEHEAEHAVRRDREHCGLARYERAVCRKEDTGRDRGKDEDRRRWRIDDRHAP